MSDDEDDEDDEDDHLMTDPAILRLHRLRVPVRLGWSEAERREPQDVLIDLVIRFDAIPRASATDDLTDTVDYRRLAEGAVQVSQREEYRLLERLAGAVHESLRPLVPADAHLEVTVTKDPRMPAVEGGASYTIRDRAGNG